VSSKKKISFLTGFLWSLAIIAPVLLCGSWLLAKKLRSTLIDELNARLQVKVEIYSLDIFLWSNFPNIGLRATGIQVKESLPFYRLNAIEADELSVVFNIWDVINDGAVIEKIKLSGAKVRLYRGKHGINFDFFKPNTSDSSDLDLELKQIQLINSQIWYIDEVEQNSANFESEKLIASGKFGEEKYRLSLKGDALFDHLKLNGNTLFMGKHLNTDSDLEVDNKVNSYHINKCLVSLGDLELDVKGDILMTSNAPDLDLQFDGKNLDLNSVLSVLPNKSFAGFKHESTSGKIFLKGKVKGKIDKEELPAMNITFGGEKVAYLGEDAPINLKELTFNGSFEKKKRSPNANLQLDIKKLQIGEGITKAKINAIIDKQIDLNINANGNLSLKDFNEVINQNLLLNYQGDLTFNLNSKLMVKREGERWKTTIQDVDGDIELKNGNATLISDSTVINGIQAKITCRNGGLNIQSLYAKWKENDALLTGEWSNFMAFATDSSNQLLFEGSLVSQNLNLNSALPVLPESENAHKTAMLVKMKLDLVVANLIWKKHDAKDVKGKLFINGEDIHLNDVYLKSMDGNINADIAFEKTENNNTRLRLKMLTQNVNISKLFERFNDFEQSEITHKNLEGFLTSDILYEQTFDEKGHVDLKSVVGLGELEITKGRLKDYKSLEALSKFVELKELRDIKFSDLKNTIEIKNGVITIPNMKIKNNALNLELNGTHSFDNEMDYNIKIFISDILAAKYDFVKRRKEKKVDQEKGGIGTYIHMYGTPDNLKIEYDKKSVTKKISEEVKTERKAFFEAIKKDFINSNHSESDSLFTPKSKDIWDE
jgi:hypothetical protein